MPPNNGIRETLDASGEYTTPVSNGPGGRPVFIATSGTWQGRLTVEWRLPGDSAFEQINEHSYTENFESSAVALPVNCEIRVGFAAGDYVSGSVTVVVTT